MSPSYRPLTNRPLVVALLGVVWFALAPGAQAQESTGPAQQPAPFDGSYTTAIPIKVPPYHGLEPKLALAYSSAGGNGWLGVGWSLSGISTIERASPGKGAPRYDDSDIFLLDGQELVPCTLGGGQFCTKVQSYKKIVYVGSHNTWRVWS